MKRSLLITTTPIDEDALIAGRQMSAGMGAAIYFAGVVRDSEGEASISAIGAGYARPGGAILIAGSPRSIAKHGFEVLQVEAPGGRAPRVFLRRMKESTVPRGT